MINLALCTLIVSASSGAKVVRTDDFRAVYSRSSGQALVYRCPNTVTGHVEAINSDKVRYYISYKRPLREKKETK